MQSNEAGRTSPYLKQNRLQDVIAAITAMGTYKFYKLDFASWADRIQGDDAKAKYWQEVFLDHPEFFRLDAPRLKASLVWRRQFPRNFDVDKEPEELADHHVSGQPFNRISRRPLEAAEITALIGVAINLHAGAMQAARDKAWWVWVFPALVGFLGALLGSLVSP